MSRENPDRPPLGTLALSAMHETSRKLGIDPFERELVAEVVQQPPPGHRELVVEPVDWHAEMAERAAAERRARAREVALELEDAEAPPRPDPPAAKRKWRKQAA